MSLSSNQVMRYLALLTDPNQNEITRQAWSVATTEQDLVWAGWQPESVVSVSQEPPPEWYDGIEQTKPVPRQDLQTRSDERAMAAYELLKSFGILDLKQLPADTVRGAGPQDEDWVPVTPPKGVEGDGLRRLASIDELHREETLGRAGWLFLAGTIRHGELDVPCCFPLFERRVKFVQVRGEFYPQWQGALRRNAILRRRVDDDVADAVDLFLQAGAGSMTPNELAGQVAEMLRQFDIDLQGVAGRDVHPTLVPLAAGTTLVPGSGFYLARPGSGLSAIQNDLTRWTSKTLFDSALAKLYRTTDSVLDKDTRPRPNWTRPRPRPGLNSSSSGARCWPPSNASRRSNRPVLRSSCLQPGAHLACWIPTSILQHCRRGRRQPLALPQDRCRSPSPWRPWPRTRERLLRRIRDRRR